MEELRLSSDPFSYLLSIRYGSSNSLECLNREKSALWRGFSVEFEIGHRSSMYQSSVILDSRTSFPFSLFFSLASHNKKVYRRCWWRWWCCAWAAAAVCWWRLSTTATTASGATPARSKSWIAVSAGSFNPVSNVRDMANAKLLLFCFVVAPPENRLLGLGDKSRNVMIVSMLKSKYEEQQERQRQVKWRLCERKRRREARSRREEEVVVFRGSS